MAVHNIQGQSKVNERIKELAIKAGAICIHREPKNRALVGYDNIEKFAELIVTECAMFVVVELEGQVGSRIADATANKLEKHFGIEE